MDIERWLRRDTLYDADGNSIFFCHKSCIHPKTIHVNAAVSGRRKKKKKDMVIDQKQMFCYSEKHTRKQRLEHSISDFEARAIFVSTEYPH